MNGNLYGYVRSSADSRDIEKQMIAIWDYGVAAENVYVEKKTAGNDSDTAYNTVVDMLKENDTLVIAALFTDEYGRQGVKPLTPAYVRILSLVQWNEGFWNSGLLDLEQYHFED